MTVTRVGFNNGGGINFTRRFKRREWKYRKWRQYRKLLCTTRYMLLVYNFDVHGHVPAGEVKLQIVQYLLKIYHKAPLL